MALTETKSPTVCVPPPKLRSVVGAVERSVAGRSAIRSALLVEPGLGDDADDEAVLVAELGGRNSGDHFHRLHGVRRDLVRVDPALLIGHGLVVDRELRLRVIADRVEEAVRVGDDARRRQRDRPDSAPKMLSSGSRATRRLIDVGVRRRVALEQILGVADHLHGRARAGQRHGQRQLDRHRVRFTSTSRSIDWKPCATISR